MKLKARVLRSEFYMLLSMNGFYPDFTDTSKKAVDLLQFAGMLTTTRRLEAKR